MAEIENAILRLKAEINELQLENHTLKDNEGEYKSKMQELKHDILLLTH